MGTHDFVYSAGLIEHFDDFGAVIKKHVDLLSPGGLLMISTPNLSPVRYCLWQVIDRRSTAAHNPLATRLEGVTRAIENAGVHVLESGYFGPSQVWSDTPDLPAFVAGKLLRVINIALRIIPFPDAIRRPLVYWVGRKS